MALFAAHPLPLIPANAGTQIKSGIAAAEVALARLAGLWPSRFVLGMFKGVFYTYVMASRRNGTIYVDSTDDLAARVRQHKERSLPGFTKKYGVTTLVWFEGHETREGAFRRERRIKEWRRSWKLMLIEDQNPDWRDLEQELHHLLPFE